MTDSELQDLRDWSATEVMGFTFCLNGCCYYHEEPQKKFVSAKRYWTPDLPETGQIWQFVERMRELGWDLQLNSEYNVLYLENAKWYADFSRIKTKQNHRPMEYESHDFIWARNSNPCLAILLAAKAALEGK